MNQEERQKELRNRANNRGNQEYRTSGFNQGGYTYNDNMTYDNFQDQDFDQSGPGKNYAIASLVLGIVSVLLPWFGYSSILGLICGIIGLIMASNAKRNNYIGGMRTAGFVLSLIGVICSSFAFLACIACGSVILGLGTMAS